jgi:hypothetical protein
MVNIALFIILSLYIFTDIRNKLVRVSDAGVFKRTVTLVLFAMMISFIQGYYVLQLKAKPMLEYSGFLKEENQPLLGISTGEDSDMAVNRINLLAYQKDRELMKIKNFSAHPSIFGKFSGWLSNTEEQGEVELYYIWSVHLSQFMMAILIGIILQLLWEDRAITEPL